MKKKFNDFINEEVGIKNISKIAKEYKNCEIYLHKDLDGVTSALAMKSYLKTYYNIEMVDCHIIQYGGLEFAVNNVKEGNMAVLVDFAHSKPMFTIATDHHDSQVGSDDTKSTYFKPARSNVETISGEISPGDIFTSTDIELIRTVDSADFLRNNITIEDIQNSIFKNDKSLSPEKNRYMMGFVVNRLLLAYKNKRITVKSLNGKYDHVNRNLLECLVMDSTPSLYSIYNNLKHYILKAKVSDKLGRLATPDELKKNLEDYINRMKSYSYIEDSHGETYEISDEQLHVLTRMHNRTKSGLPIMALNLDMDLDYLKDIIKELEAKKYIIYKDYKYRYAHNGNKILDKIGLFRGEVSSQDRLSTTKGVHMDEHKIIIQYGGGTMFEPGSYDRYTPFKNNPEANFLCIIWPIGLIQLSKNPFKKNTLPDIDLGKISKEVLSGYKEKLENFFITLNAVKYDNENSQEWYKMRRDEGELHDGVGFRFSDLKAFYSNCIYDRNMNLIDLDEIANLKDIMNKNYIDLSNEDKDLLKTLKISMWDIITRASGGHPSITNISGFNYLKYNSYSLKSMFNTNLFTNVMKKVARSLVNNLKEKIDISESGEEVVYKDVEVNLTGGDLNESINIDKTNSIISNIKLMKFDEFKKNN